MIKFRCVHCNKKYGVPDEWAGKRIRCKRCKDSCLVPYPQIELRTAPAVPETPAVAEKEIPTEVRESIGVSSDLLDFPAGKSLSKGPALNFPKTGDPLSDQGRIQKKGEGGNRTIGFKKRGNFFLAMGLGIVFTLAAGVVWTGISYFFIFDLFFLVIGVGWAAGLGIAVGSRNPGLLTGMAGVVIGLGGMMAAKVMKAECLYLPMARAEMDKEIAFWARLEKGFSDTELNRIISKFKNPTIHDDTPELPNIFGMALSGKLVEFVQDMWHDNMIMFISCRCHLEDKGEISGGQPLPVLGAPVMAEDPNLMRMNRIVADKIERLIQSSSQLELRQILVDHLPAGASQISAQLRAVHIGISRIIRFVFCPYDIFWIPLGVFVAYYMASRPLPI